MIVRVVADVFDEPFWAFSPPELDARIMADYPESGGSISLTSEMLTKYGVTGFVQKGNEKYPTLTLDDSEKVREHLIQTIRAAETVMPTAPGDERRIADAVLARFTIKEKPGWD